jgi:S-methylmethionine-dependent homocysteine/selenocysteine methylase
MNVMSVSLDVLGVGINCTDPRCISELLDTMSSLLGTKTSHPVVVYPNKGNHQALRASV